MKRWIGLCLLFILVCLAGYAQDVRVIHVEKPGTLLNILPEGSELTKGEIIKIEGELYNDDLYAFEKWQNDYRYSLDLSKAIVDTIPIEAFREHRSIEKIILPASLVLIESSAFYLCSNLQVVDFTDCSNLVSIGRNAFFDCEKLTNLNLSYCINIEEVGVNAFFALGRQTSNPLTCDLSPCEKLKKIEGTAFVHAWINKIVLPNNIEYIGGSAFFDTEITELKLPKSIKYLGLDFVPDDLKKLIIESSIPISLDKSLFSSDYVKSNMKLLVPFGSKDNYQSAPFWSDLRIIEEYGYCTITCLNKGGGSVKIGEETIQSGEVSVAEATDVQVFFIPDKGYCLKQVQLENEDVTGQVKNNVLTISKIIENKELTVVFEEDVPVTYTVKVSYNEGGTVKIGEESITSGSSKLVTASTDVTFSIISNTGYHVKSVKLGELDITTLLKDNQFKIESVTENKELTVEFEKNAPVTYTIKVNYNDGGTVKIDNETITNGSSKTAAASSKVTFSIVPNPGYHVKSVKLGDTDVTISLKDNQFTIESISENKELTVVFEQTTYSVKVTYNTGGTIKVNNDAVNSGAVKNVNALTNVMVSIVPNPGFHIKSVKLGTSDVMTLLENNLLHIASITEDKELTVEFEKDALSIYTVKIIYNEGGTVKIGNETIANGSSKTVSASTDITVSIIPNMGYHVKCVKLGTADVTTLLENNQLSIVSISENKELTVVFEEDASITHTVKVTYNEGGIVKIGNESIANGSAKEVAEKEDVTISIIPNTGYHVKSVKLNKMDVTDEVKNNKLIITSIEANQELTITFEVDTPKTYSVKVNYNTGGTVKVNNDAIANGAAKTVNALTDVQVSMIPNDGYLLKQVKLGVADVTDQIVNNVLTIPAIAGDREVSVVFEKGSLVTYSVKVSYSSGGIVKVNNYSVESGTSLTVQKSAKVSVVFIPDHGCYLKQVLSEGKDVTLQVNGNLLEVESVTKDLEIVAIFEKIPMVSCMVDITGNGRVKVNGQTIDQSLETVSVEKGSTVTFSFIPDAKYELGNVLVNNQNVTNKVKNNMYQISTLISDITCQVEFVLIDDPTSIEQVENANKRIYRSAPRRLALSGFKAGVPIYVYDGSGRLVVLKTIRDSVEEVDVPADGLYFVRIGKESFKVIL